MKKMGIASFTERGRKRAEEVRKIFLGEYQILPYEKDRGESLKEWCLRCFGEGEALVFVGACGIAVRTIAPFLQDKTKDPRCLSWMRRKIRDLSCLRPSGRRQPSGFKNRESLGAEPVITTATDVNGKFAVDVFAKDNQLAISSMKAAKEISAAVLRGSRVYLFCHGKIKEKFRKN